MTKALFLYSSREGQTKKILRYIEQELPQLDVETKDLHEVKEIDVGQYSRILIGASIRYGHLNRHLYRFIERHQRYLQSNKVAFFCVNLTARKEDQAKDTPEGSAYIRKFLAKSTWKPELIGVFAGALYYPRYHWFDKMMIKFIMRMTGGETDTTKEVEYTNWKKVALFAQKFMDL
ncbi:menaquinone-dependent protoporphyrinogen IX dehydrogenase [Vibrio ostreicida]|uniref:Protoporphyrinogen IX dehydrogenase [quinone] n=1 Tax=Vibrio ostreicida TaxID=526588 RepID=A0ABT8BP23_9VIBR|nr:menaquinone-dependent protoporphyrinogen IX dehydrogenase [Vibrio ostreicida]MDN3608658.1 menaquinone-dependent protoporphyrinogen IX dehydrogenase [Vibrio ostreicida]NPD10709.1 menaquinone-dependent protoporphyrinogen IX dehydrogenase [Vibrio ostreicida]